MPLEDTAGILKAPFPIPSAHPMQQRGFESNFVSWSCKVMEGQPSSWNLAFPWLFPNKKYQKRSFGMKNISKSACFGGITEGYKRRPHELDQKCPAGVHDDHQYLSRCPPSIFRKWAWPHGSFRSRASVWPLEISMAVEIFKMLLWQQLTTQHKNLHSMAEGSHFVSGLISWNSSFGVATLYQLPSWCLTSPEVPSQNPKVQGLEI